MRSLIDKLAEERNLTHEEFKILIESDKESDYLYKKADKVRREFYGNKVYIRGLIEISNYCKNDCYYCGIRCSNKSADRYRLSEDQILECARYGYELGFRTFVMQGGEDSYFSDDIVCRIIFKIKEEYPDCAVTLSLGERSFESYKKMYDAGADRYLLRHETAEEEHYGKLHPDKMSLQNRKDCLFNLKKIGYQTGSGFMVGSPYQTTENLVSDIKFLRELKPQMIGIGPFIRHEQTPFADFSSGSFLKTLRLLSILRLIFPKALIPSTTALGTIHPKGREMGILAGANVVMPNLSPVDLRKLYNLYDGKLHTDEEAAEGLLKLKNQMQDIGYEIVYERGDAIK